MTFVAISMNVCGAAPELDAAGKSQMRGKAQRAIDSGHESFGDMSDEWVADRVRMLSRNDLDHEAICCASRDRIMRLSLEVERLHALIHSPHTDDFLESVRTEAAFQREHWKAEHDGGKTDADWFWLIGYLGGKALAAIGLVERADLVRDVEHFRSKALHHIITTAAACLNWHMARTVGTDMRPGIAEPALPNNQEAKS